MSCLVLDGASDLYHSHICNAHKACNTRSSKPTEELELLQNTCLTYVWLHSKWTKLRWERHVMWYLVRLLKGFFLLFLLLLLWKNAGYFYGSQRSARVVCITVTVAAGVCVIVPSNCTAMAFALFRIPQLTNDYYTTYTTRPLTIHTLLCLYALRLSAAHR